jgi:DNA-binding protein HU-beta
VKYFRSNVKVDCFWHHDFHRFSNFRFFNEFDICKVALSGLTRKEAKLSLTTLQTIGSFEMKKRGQFVLPGFAKFTVKNVPAKPARKGINPFTREECIFKAKPARKVVKARPAAALKKSML